MRLAVRLEIEDANRAQFLMLRSQLVARPSTQLLDKRLGIEICG